MEEIRELYELYRGDVFRYLARLTGDAELTEDLVSETFLSAITALPGFRGDTDVKRWLFTIARNKWYDHLRRARQNVSIDKVQFADCGPVPEEWVFQRLAIAHFWKLLEEEEPRAMQAVSMRLQGYSFYEIGQALGIREGSARVIVFRTRNRLRERMEQEGYCETV